MSGKGKKHLASHMKELGAKSAKKNNASWTKVRRDSLLWKKWGNMTLFASQESSSLQRGIFITMQKNLNLVMQVLLH